uniref:Uncharacterized protein n=1 Tax=Lotus japonicus TaxID=34305 RepID=I3SYR5_LOTJA|nr:unknown [Lotus japonicus]
MPNLSSFCFCLRFCMYALKHHNLVS